MNKYVMEKRKRQKTEQHVLMERAEHGERQNWRDMSVTGVKEG